MAGRRTSVYLSEPVAELLKASGRQLAEVIATGLGIEPEPREEVIRRVLREELAALPLGAALPRDPAAAPCSHTYPDVKTIMGKRVCTKCD